MYRVQYKASNAGNSWCGYGTYSSEASAMQVAGLISGRYFAVRVIDREGRVVWVE